MKRIRCAVCHAACGQLMCPPCEQSYDRWNRRAVGDNISLIEWAAARARRMERRRLRGSR